MIRLAFLAAFLASTCQVGPFADERPQPEPVFEPPPMAAAPSCPAAIENSKRLGCGFEADDAGAWCATRSAKEVACMSSTKTTNCLALRQCTEPSK